MTTQTTTCLSCHGEGKVPTVEALQQQAKAKAQKRAARLWVDVKMTIRRLFMVLVTLATWPMVITVAKGIGLFTIWSMGLPPDKTTDIISISVGIGAMMGWLPGVFMVAMWVAPAWSERPE